MGGWHLGGAWPGATIASAPAEIVYKSLMLEALVATLLEVRRLGLAECVHLRVSLNVFISAQMLANFLLFILISFCRFRGYYRWFKCHNLWAQHPLLSQGCPRPLIRLPLRANHIVHALPKSRRIRDDRVRKQPLIGRVPRCRQLFDYIFDDNVRLR